MTDIKLKCSCGEVQGIAQNISPKNGTRLVCYCEDCQAFVRQLGRDGDILNEFGGTDIYQLTPSQVKIISGTKNIDCLRLTSKGLYRWYASCCKTPIGNMGGAGMPFIGVILGFIDEAEEKDAKLGTVLGSVHYKNLEASLPSDIKGPRSQLSLTLRVLKKLLLWKLKGMANPNPFFKSNGKPIVEPKIIA